MQRFSKLLMFAESLTSIRELYFSETKLGKWKKNVTEPYPFRKSSHPVLDAQGRMLTACIRARTSRTRLARLSNSNRSSEWKRPLTGQHPKGNVAVRDFDLCSWAREVIFLNVSIHFEFFVEKSILFQIVSGWLRRIKLRKWIYSDFWMLFGRYLFEIRKTSLQQHTE